ncbi:MULTISPECIES: BlaI/MecI/CopY family transcriptional regulator [unclassified Lysinibacillus]|uniref:BlaI/MecI/CopY family transcriptional regulator n=1 Tax=unclassified Lysinibacillus TaxID=2636778 RepID=UPI0037F1D75A
MEISFQRLSTMEKKIMDFIWEKNSSVTTREIMESISEAKNWKHNTTITFLSRLIKKGFLTATRVGKAHHYEACFTAKEYLDFETKQFINEVHKGSILGFVSTLCDNGDLTREEIEHLMKRLEE